MPIYRPSLLMASRRMKRWSSCTEAGLDLVPPGDLTTDLVSYWRLSDGTDECAGSNDLVAYPDIGTPTFASGKIDNGLLTGRYSDDPWTPAYLYIADGDQQNLDMSGVSGYSMSCWVRFTVADTDQYFLGKGNNGGNGYGMAMFGQSYGKFGCWQRNGASNTGYQYDGDGVTPQGSTWYHLVQRWTGTAMQLWVNGQKEVDYACAFAPGDTSDGFGVGGYAVSGFENISLDGGMMDEVGVWSRAITDDEIADLYNAGDGYQVT